MAKVKFPLMSGDASGKFSNRMIFRRGGVVTRWFRPRNPNTEAQRAVREAFKEFSMPGLTQEQADLLYSAITHLHDERYLQSVPQQDHGGLAGLGDDDHLHYYNQSRGDERYLKIADQGNKLIYDSGILQADQAYIEITSIPATYKDIQLRLSLRSNAAQNYEAVMMRFNGDTAANYQYFVAQLSHSAGYATFEGLAVSAMWMAHCSGDQSVSGDFSRAVVDVLDYANVNVNKPVLTYGGNRAYSTTGLLRLYNFYSEWVSLAAITSLRLYPRDGTAWKKYSRVALYGIK
jgi:hypothetical protein